MIKNWRTSSHTIQNEACVEVGADDAVMIRDTKYAFRDEGPSPVLSFRPQEFAALVHEIKQGTLDL